MNHDRWSILWIALILITISTTTCGHICPPPEPPRVIKKSENCMEASPPLPRVLWPTPDDNGYLSLDPDTQAALFQLLAILRDYVSDQWYRCGDSTLPEYKPKIPIDD